VYGICDEAGCQGHLYSIDQRDGEVSLYRRPKKRRKSWTATDLVRGRLVSFFFFTVVVEEKMQLDLTVGLQAEFVLCT
jgi:hypothetical protein